MSVLPRSTFVLVVCFGLLVANADLCRAQNQFFPPPVPVPQPPMGVIDVANEAQRQIDALARQHRQTLTTLLAVKIDDLNRVCQLEPAQLKKLQVAAKGAVEQMLESWKKQHEGQLRQLGVGVQFIGNDDIVIEAQGVIVVEVQGAAPGFVDVPPRQGQVGVAGNDEAAAPADEGAAELQPGDAVVAGQLIAPPLVAAPLQAGRLIAPAIPAFAQGQWHAGVGMAGELPVEEQKVWVRALETILTAEQKHQYQVAQQERKQRRQRAALDLVLVALDDALLLSDQQHEQLLKMIASHCGEQLGKIHDVSGAQFVAVGIARELPQEALQEMLTEAQWTRLNEIASVQPQMWQDAALPLIPLLPAQPLFAPGADDDTDDHDS